VKAIFKEIYIYKTEKNRGGKAAGCASAVLPLLHQDEKQGRIPDQMNYSLLKLLAAHKGLRKLCFYIQRTHFTKCNFSNIWNLSCIK